MRESNIPRWLLTRKALSKIVADDILILFFIIFRENKICYFIWIVRRADDSYEFSSLIFSEKTNKQKNM